MRGDVLKHVGATDPETKKAAEQNIQKLRQTVAQQFREYAKTITDEENRRLFLKVGPTFERYYAVCGAVLRVSSVGESAAARRKYENESIKAGVYKAAKSAVQDAMGTPVKWRSLLLRCRRC